MDICESLQVRHTECESDKEPDAGIWRAVRSFAEKWGEGNHLPTVCGIAERKFGRIEGGLNSGKEQ